MSSKVRAVALACAAWAWLGSRGLMSGTSCLGLRLFILGPRPSHHPRHPEQQSPGLGGGAAGGQTPRTCSPLSPRTCLLTASQELPATRAAGLQPSAQPPPLEQLSKWAPRDSQHLDSLGLHPCDCWPPSWYTSEPRNPALRKPAGKSQPEPGAGQELQPNCQQQAPLRKGGGPEGFPSAARLAASDPLFMSYSRHRPKESSWCCRAPKEAEGPGALRV